jgi:outer membrane protein TolC
MLLFALAGCSHWQAFRRPDGHGGMTPAEREHETERLAIASLTTLPDRGDQGSTPDGEPTGVLDLAQALAMVEKGNSRIAEAREQLAAAGERVAEVRGRLLPAAAASARYTRYSDDQTTNVEFAGTLPPELTTPVVRVREIDEGTAHSSVTLPLDLSGELRHALSAAQAGYRGEAARVWAVTLEEQLALVEAYFGLLEAQSLRQVSLETRRLYQEQLDTARRRFDAGRLTRNEVLIVEVALAETEQELLRRELAIARARWALNRIVGLEVNAPTEVADVRFSPAVLPIEGILRQAYAENPLLTSLLEEQRRLEETATSLERSRLPSFVAGGTADYTSSDLLEPALIGSGFVGFEWDLGTDLRREARIAEARIEIDRNRVALQGQMRELEAALRAARRALEERLAAHRTAELAVRQAEENLHIRTQQFAVGRAESQDVLIAESLLARQRATRATSLYQAHVQRAALQRLMGVPLTEVAAPPIDGRKR